MNNKLEILKKRLIYRAGYRGTKEMDILLSSFVNKNIEHFDENLLNELDNFLNFETFKNHSNFIFINFFLNDALLIKTKYNFILKIKKFF